LIGAKSLAQFEVLPLAETAMLQEIADQFTLSELRERFAAALQLPGKVELQSGANANSAATTDIDLF
jgi:hypothetical protein